MKKKTDVTEFTLDDAFREAEQVLELARKQRNPTAMLAAVNLRAALAGHLVQKSEVAVRTERDLTDEELKEELVEAAKELLAKYGND